jgi:HemY protein
MMRPLLLFLFIALAGALIALSFYGNNGYVLLHYSPYTVETSLTFFVFVLVLLVVAGLLLLRLLRFGLLLPRNIREALRNRHNRRARESLVRGLIKLAEGKWTAAEHEITRQAPQHDASVVNYLYAARVAQHRGDLDKRDQYLRLAYGAKPQAEIAVLLTQAELQIEAEQLTQALASLLRVRQLEADQPRARQMLAELYARLQDWAALYPLLLEIEKAGLLPPERWLELAVQAQHALLRTAAAQGAEALQAAWGALPKPLRRHPRLVHTQAGLLAAAGARAQAIELLRNALDHAWDDELGLLFSSLQGDDPVAQLAAVEAWLKQHGEQPALLLVAGRLCRQNKLWGRARSYLEASLKLKPRADALLELGRVHEATQNAAAAQAAYRQGLELAAAESAQHQAN